MNPSTLIGIVASIGLLAVVVLFAAKEPALFIDLPSLGIVLVGTLAATFISYPLREVTRVFGLLWTVLRNERLYTRQDLDELVQISRLWISGDLPAVEKAVEQVSNPFLRTGVQLVIDNTPGGGHSGGAAMAHRPPARTGERGGAAVPRDGQLRAGVRHDRHAGGPD